MSVKIPKWLAELVDQLNDAYPGQSVDVAEEAHSRACSESADLDVYLLQLVIDEVTKLRRQMDAMVTATCELGGDLEACRAIVSPLEELRANEGATVLVPCDNPDPCDDHSYGCLVEVTDDWTDWKPRTVTGENLPDALAKAVEAKEAAEKTGGES